MDFVYRVLNFDICIDWFDINWIIRVDFDDVMGVGIVFLQYVLIFGVLRLLLFNIWMQFFLQFENFLMFMCVKVKVIWLFVLNFLINIIKSKQNFEVYWYNFRL